MSQFILNLTCPDCGHVGDTRPVDFSEEFEQVRRATIEECAKVAEGWSVREHWLAKGIARAIRALAQHKPEGGE